MQAYVTFRLVEGADVRIARREGRPTPKRPSNTRIKHALRRRLKRADRQRAARLHREAPDTLREHFEDMLDQVGFTLGVSPDALRRDPDEQTWWDDYRYPPEDFYDNGFYS